jgi:sulfopyruvate decarboxylase TPP-binding subunit
MATPERAQQFLTGLKEAGIDSVASVPDINLLHLLNALYADKDIIHPLVGREEKGIGVCAGAYAGGKRVAMLMQNGGWTKWKTNTASSVTWKKPKGPQSCACRYRQATIKK